MAQFYYAGLLGLLKRHRAAGPYSRHVTQAVHFILERYPGYVTLELAAGAIGLNSSYLSRIFKEETRRTFSEYLNQVRIDAGRKRWKAANTRSRKSAIKWVSRPITIFKVFKEITG